MEPPPLHRRPLGPPDEPALRAFWARAPHASIFAIPDLDYLGWGDMRLEYTGWFAGDVLVAYLMVFGVSAQWDYTDERVVPQLAQSLRYAGRAIEFISGLEERVWPVLDHFPSSALGRHELSTVAHLPPACFQAATLEAPRGRARQATRHDLEALTAVHVAAPDQFNRLSYPVRRQVLHAALNDGWRRIFLAEAPDGTVVASAQTSAEGREMAVIGGVVTHPAYRGRGYGTLVTAHLCAALLAENKEPFLYYRRDNVPAARAYARIGFVPLADALLAEVNL